jgi:hypothetical protein
MRRAFYLLAPGGWRDYANVLHAPYTLWHLSYVALGAALAPAPDYRLLVWTLLAFLLAMGVGAHALDELRGRPLCTAIPAPILWGMAVAGTSAAVVVGLVVGLPVTPWLLPFIAAGAVLVFAYNLEWGPFHHDLVFAVAWGAFPVLTSYLVQTGGLSIACVLIALAAAAVSLVQRTLSTRVRYLRRTVVEAGGYLLDAQGHKTLLTREWLVADYERALIVLAVTMPIIALGVLLR